MGQALKALDPDSVAKSMAYLANVASALSDLSNVAKQTAEAEKKLLMIRFCFPMITLLPR